MKKYIIVATDLKGAIGKNNTIPWRQKADMKSFKAITFENTVIMGRKTFESIGKALPKRNNIVISRNKDFSVEGITVCDSFEAAVGVAETLGKDIFFIGGSEVYKQALPICEELLLTTIFTTIEDADTFFPENWADFYKAAESTVVYESDENNDFCYKFTPCQRYL
jgi:dihydrofolate reductase